MTPDTRTDLPETFDQRALLSTMLDYARTTVHVKCADLAEEHARSAPLSTSPLTTMSGLVSRLRWVENWWFEVIFQDRPDESPITDEDPDAEMRATAPLDTLLADYAAQCARSNEIIAVHDLDTPAQRTMRNGERVTLGWIVLHLIEETARHNGHLDILREMADGVTGD